MQDVIKYDDRKHTWKEPQSVILSSDLEKKIEKLFAERFLFRESKDLRQNDIKAGEYEPGPQKGAALL